MAFCSNCGTEATGAFCPNCGSALSGAAGTAGAAGASSAAGAGSSVYAPPAAAGLTNNIVAALCYLLGIIGGVIFLLLEPYNKDPFVRFHAFQSIFFTVAWVVVMMALGVLGMATHGITFLLYPICQLAFLIGWIYMIITAYQGKKIVLPVIGELAQKQS